ncbi:MAG: dihydroorotate dehydrogenase electron transfer subunit [Eubacteriales bacterium]|nr:dihydroorotate dehydrogenase electron transfer subunit [Eubacteriales bacterium]
MPSSERIRLVQTEQLNSHAYRLEFLAPQIAAEAKPGQFLMLESPVYLKRPYGIMSANAKEGKIELGIDTVGRGSKWHVALNPGSELQALGPLGHGFNPPQPGRKLILMGGGSGLYPLISAAEANYEKELLVVLGFRSKEEAILAERFEALGARVLLSSDQGGLDFHGNAVSALASILAAEAIQEAELWSCGPVPMLKAAAELAAQKGFTCQLSFEARMACGLGFCSGCAIPIKSSLPQRCCYEGPVFAAESIDWEALYA